MFILVLLLWVCFASPLIICFGLGVSQHLALLPFGSCCALLLRLYAAM